MNFSVKIEKSDALPVTAKIGKVHTFGFLQTEELQSTREFRKMMSATSRLRRYI